MEHPIIAMVHIEFIKRNLKEEDIRAVGALLRAHQDIYHLIVHERTIAFYIWGNERIHYGILDQIKKELKNRDYFNFVMTADEYVKTGQKYYYDASQDREAEESRQIVRIPASE